MLFFVLVFAIIAALIFTKLPILRPVVVAFLGWLVIGAATVANLALLVGLLFFFGPGIFPDGNESIYFQIAGAKYDEISSFGGLFVFFLFWIPIDCIYTIFAIALVTNPLVTIIPIGLLLVTIWNVLKFVYLSAIISEHQREHGW